MLSKTQDRLVDQWRETQRAYTATAARLEKALEAHGLGLNEFEVLDRVAEVPKNECLMKDLTELCPLTQSALSRIVDRLVKAGYMQRVSCDADRRAIFLKITDAGREVHARAAESYRDALSSSM